MTTKITLTAKDIFNALSNAKHIFSFKEEGTKIKLLKIVDTDEACKAVIQTEHGEIDGLFTDSASAKQALHEVMNCFGDDQPFIVIKLKTTAKGASVYYVEVE